MIDKTIYSDWIGCEIIKKSGKPFKSRLNVGIPIKIVKNPFSYRNGFLMGDESIVDCHQCILKQ